MAFLAEDGTGLENANSYVDLTFADSYFEDRGNAVWAAASEAQKKVALIKATDYVESRFTFHGEPYSDDQALHFPTEDYESDDPAVMPVNLLKAVSEYALRALSAELAPDLAVDDTGGRVVEKTEKVGPLEETTKYSEATAIQRFRPYPAADILLRGLVVDTSNQVIR